MNVFLILLILFPVISVILGIAGYAIFKNIIAASAVVFFASMIALYLVFNETFLIWVFVYTILALVSGVFVKAFNKKVN
ncbi:DUF2651 family protein [Rossellomorea oryzaecorticis]|uniref:DUF2651 family protein n=1 Tax=Rossellomorea oryzaecorticis TaxID=1396505 RepID=A0ABW8VWR8_9BACI